MTTSPAVTIKQKVFIKTYGCGMNLYDSHRMIDLLSPLGFNIIDTVDGADLVIFNTCAIREKASEKLYSDLGRVKSAKQDRQASGDDMLVAVAGCVAQAEGSEIMRRAPYVDMVFGPQSYQDLPKMLAQAQRQKDINNSGGHKYKPKLGILNIDFPEIPKFDTLPEITSHEAVSANVAIQEGCDKYCHFCVVPYTRGAEYSRPVLAVLNDIRRLASRGVREIVLLGQNVNAYHGEAPDGQGEWDLGQLIYAIAEIDGIVSIRYMTSHPRDVTDNLIRAHSEVTKLSPFLHLPVQSGSDRILKAMNRQHTRNFYLDIIKKFKAANSKIAVSSDFIVGYPGESDQDFQDTLALIDTVKFAQAYSFKYSPRPGTPAWNRQDQVPEDIKDQRLQTVQALISHHQKEFNKSFIGQTIPLLIEKPGKHPGQFMGRSPYMQSVNVQAYKRLIGHTVDVKITHAHTHNLKGDLIMHHDVEHKKNIQAAHCVNGL